MDGHDVAADTGGLDRRRFLAGMGRAAATVVAGRAALVSATSGGALLAASTGAWAGEGHAIGRGADQHAPDVLSRWYDTIYSGLMDEGTTPPPAARIYAVCAIAAYEAVVGGAPGARTLAGQLNGLGPVPHTTKANAIDWPTAVSSSVAAAIGDLLHNPKPAFAAAIESRRSAELRVRREAGIPANIIDRSRAYGEAIGRHVAAWAAGDGSAGTSRPYAPPPGEANWRSTPPNFGKAIDPYWGAEVRPMALPHPDACPPPPMRASFSTEAGSDFWNEAQAVIDAVASGTPDDRAIALFWRDNPLTSGLPAGHWMRVVVQTATEQGYALDRTAEVLALTGITLADAFTACWRGKYQVNLLRPISYIHTYILPPPTKPDGTPDHNHPDAWRSPVNTPQFPEYTSGHSVGSQAAATMLTAVMGEFPFTDSTSLLRNPHIPPRWFTSFQHAAEEAAGSRLKGGIHYPMGIDQGRIQGRSVGETVLARVRTR